MKNKLISVIQPYCNYKINHAVQLINSDIDTEKIRQEILSFLLKNQFNYKSVSLRLPEISSDNQDYLTPSESVFETGVGFYQIETNTQAGNLRPGEDYKYWHPDLENSYTKTVVEKLELLSGFNISRVRLVWLLPTEGYPMHVDIEPMRFHIPIITNKLSYFLEDDSLYHMESGKLYHLVTSTLHAAWNYGKLPRLHLIFSSYYSAELANKITELFDIEEVKKEYYYDHLSSIDTPTIKALMKLAPSYQVDIPNKQVQHTMDCSQSFYLRLILELEKQAKSK
jgi:hypothetical protein